MSTSTGTSPSRSQFKVLIGAKRQMTMPSQVMQLLDLEEGDELLCEVNEDQATLTPIFSIARTDLPESLRKQFVKRRGRKPTDLNLSQFLSTLKDGSLDSQYRQHLVRQAMHHPQQQAAEGIDRPETSEKTD